LIVEYKGGNGWTDASDDRLIGALWAGMSGGTCFFVMLKNRQWEAIDPFLA
jgi:type III restriction enzyme